MLMAVHGKAERFRSLQVSGALVRAVVSLLVIVLFNLPLWLASLHNEVNRAIFNLDGLIAVAIGFWFRSLGVVFLLLAWVADIIVSQSLNYHFRSPADFLASAQFGGALDVRYLLSAADWAVLTGFVGTFFVIRRIQWLRSSVWTFVIALVALAAADALNGSSILSKRDVRIVSTNLAGSPTFVLAVGLKKMTEIHPLIASADERSRNLHREIYSWVTHHPQGSVLLVVVESLGMPVDHRLAGWLASRLWPPQSVSARRVVASTVEFRGPTTWGELRTLCLLNGSYDGLSPGSARRCLPNMVAAAGWQTHGFHGFTGNMFDRNAWWPQVGIRQFSFAEQFRRDMQTQCGAAFRGFCDADVIKAAADMLKPRMLSYVLTLNTHLPLPPQSVPHELQPLCDQAQIPETACQMVTALGKVLNEIRIQAEAHPDALVVVVGDHAPPFRERTARHAFSATDVPAWALFPPEVSASQ